MSSFRVLLIEENHEDAERISSVLAQANHTVLPAHGFAEASEALQVQRFDAILMGTLGPESIAEFTAKLRQVERKHRSSSRTAVLSFAPRESVGARATEVGIDAFLPKEFEAATFSEAVTTLARAVTSSPGAAAAISDMPVFEPEEFEAQVAYDRELMVEIIDLFLAERPDQVNDMRTAMAAGDFQRLSRAAHTIKGSLGSMHAPQAKAHAQQLELAARNQEDQVCRFCLAALEQDLDVLEPHLLALRDSVTQQ